ncbi:MAG: hypothetical protein R2766_06465 [Saprospiraceae bacterium]
MGDIVIIIGYALMTRQKKQKFQTYCSIPRRKQSAHLIHCEKSLRKASR